MKKKYSLLESALEDQEEESLLSSALKQQEEEEEYKRWKEAQNKALNGLDIINRRRGSSVAFDGQQITPAQQARIDMLENARTRSGRQALWQAAEDKALKNRNSIGLVDPEIANVYGRMAEDAARIGDEELLEKAKAGYQNITNASRRQWDEETRRRQGTAYQPGQVAPTATGSPYDAYSQITKASNDINYYYRMADFAAQMGMEPLYNEAIRKIEELAGSASQDAAIALDQGKSVDYKQQYDKNASGWYNSAAALEEMASIYGTPEQQAYYSDEKRKAGLKYEKDQPSLYYAQTMSRDEIQTQMDYWQQQVDRLEAENKRLSDRQNEITAMNPEYYEDGRQVTSEEELRKLQAMRDEEIQSLGSNIEDNRATYKNAYAQLQRYQQALTVNNVQIAKQAQWDVLNDPRYSELVKEGKAKYEQDKEGDWTRVFFSAGEANQAYKDLERNQMEFGLSEQETQIYYAIYAKDPDKAHAYAEARYQVHVSRFADKLRGVTDDSPWARASFTANAAALKLIAGLTPFTRLGRNISEVSNMLLDASGESLKEKGILNTGLLSGTIHTETFGDLSLKDATNLASSIIQSWLIAQTAGVAGVAMAGAGASAAAVESATEVAALFGTALMGSSAANDTFYQKIDQGVDTGAALVEALTAGINEALFEYISVDKLVNQDITRGFLRNVVTQGLTEASEELCTTIANTIDESVIAGITGNEREIDYNARQLMAQGMSYDEAYSQARHDWMVGLIQDAVGGFLSGGAMTMGNYASGGINNVGAKIKELQYNRQSSERAGRSVQNAGEAQALQDFAKANGIKYDEKSVTATQERITSQTEAAKASEEMTVREMQDSETAQESGKEGKQSKKETRTLGELKNQVTDKISQTIRKEGIESAERIRNQLVEKYGEGILPSVYQAISTVAAQKASTLASTDAIRTARNKAVQSIQDADVRQAVVDGYDQAAVYRAAQTNDADELGRYIQQTRNTGEGTMTMEATVKAEDGSERQAAITGMSEDGKSVVLSDGVKIDVKDLQADADTMDVVQQLSRLELGRNTDKVFQAFRQSGLTGSEGYRFIMDYATAYNQGRTGSLTLEEATKRSSLDARTVMDAYELGQKETYADTQKAVDKVKAMPVKEGATGHKANIDVSRIEGKTMNQSEQEQFDFANKVFAAAGVDVVWFASDEKGGRFVGKNGAYENGKIWMDIHAGRNFLSDLSSGIMATTGHELTHFLQQYAPEHYQALKQFLFRQIVKNSKNGEMTLERLIWEKQKRSGTKLSRKAAEDEVVADACQKMLRDSKAVHEFASQNEEAAKGIARWLDKWFAKIRDIFGRSAQFSEEAEFMDRLGADVKKAFGELWDAAMREAVRTHDEVGDMKNPATEGGVQYMARDSAEVDSIKKQLSENEATLNAMNPVANITTPNLSSMNTRQRRAWANERLKPTGYQVDRQNFGVVLFSDAQINDSLNYLNTVDEVASIAALPQLLKRGKVIEEHIRHKGRNYDTVTIAGPVILNGTRYNMAAVVRKTKGNRYHTHRIMLPSGAVLAFTETKNAEATPALSSGNTEEQYTPITSASGDIVAQSKKKSNTSKQKNSDRDNEYLELAKDPEKNAVRLQEMVDEAAKQAGYTIRAQHGSFSDDAYQEAQKDGTPYEMYQRTAGEIESRDVQNRMGFTDEERRNNRPDIDRKDVVFTENANVTLDVQSESAAPSDGTLFSERTWTASRFVQDRENAAKALAKALDVAQKQAEKYIDDINSVAKAIADDRARLDYMSSPGRSAFKSNAEYGGSIDFSTLCKKRQLLTGTFNAIQHALANTVLTAEDVLRIRQMMQDAGLEVNCGMCYVEGSRARMGEYNKTFLELYKKYYPDNWQPKMEDVNTTDGLELMRMEHPECYEQYEHFYNNHGTLRSEDKAIFSSQAKPKEYQLRTEYKGEIAEKFKKDSTVKEKNLNGGLRMQSFSDFEIVHLIDCMQVIMDMSEVGLAGQAYTKVPEFAEALGKTGLKINLSLVAKGVDENGKLIFNDVEGMPHERAFGIREKYSENVGTILVVYDDAQLIAALADDKVDFIIPFHRSQWKKSQYAAMGLPKTTKDYTYQQNEKWLNPKEHTHEYRGKTVPTKCTNYMPNEYWNFDLTGKQNAENYLAMCARDGKRPKFYKILQNNGDGSFSLKDDGSTDGYWKLLIDFKMYDNNGVGVRQQAVQPIFDMDNARQMLDDYSGDPSKFPVAQGIVDQFVEQYKKEHPGRQYSERDYSQKSDYEILRELDPMTAASNAELRKNLELTQKRLSKVQGQQYELNSLRKQIAAATGEKRAALEQKAKALQSKITGNVQEIDKSLNTSSMQNLLKAQRAAAREKASQQFAERRDKKNIRDRIKNLHAEMTRDLLRPREGHYIPQNFVRSAAELLDMINTQTDRAKSEDAQAKIDALNAAYDRLKNDERYSQFYDETVKQMLVELSATVAGRSIYDLSASELEDVYTAMKAMRTTIRNAIKADLIEKGRTAWEIGDQLRQELRRGKGISWQFAEKYLMTMLSAKRAFNRFGGYRQDSTWNKVYQMLDNAQLKQLTMEMQATRLFDPVLKAKADLKQAEALTSYSKKDLVDVGLKDEHGDAVPITRGMMLSLYMHMQNEENMRHLMYGGLTLPDFQRYYKSQGEAWGRGSVEIPALGAKVANLDQLFDELGEEGVDQKYQEYEQEIREMFESVRSAIEEELTDYDRKWIDASRQFFDGFSRQELNKVTNELYGFSKAKVDNYFPIVTDPAFLKSEFESISRNISLENAGFMKERVKASNPILLEDITRAVNRQINNVSRYAGLTQALKQFGMIYNTQTKGFTDSIKKAMQKTYGQNGLKYIENLITDMIGGRSQEGSIFDKIKGNYAQAVLSANLSVTIKQAASFPTAAATVGWGPILKALAKGGKSGLPISRADRALIDTYSPLLWKRAQGAIDTEIGDMAHAKDWTKKAQWLMGWIQKTDLATVGRLWSAAEYYVKDNFKTLEKGTEEQIKNGESPFYRKVAEVFNQIVEDTQPNYTVLQRPDILRNPNKLVRAMTMFSTQRFQNANILMDAVNEYAAMVRYDKQGRTAETKAARKEAKAKLTRAISSQVVSAVVLNAMTLLAGAILHRMNPWRDDDDELTAASIAEEYLNGFISSLAGSFLGGSELYEAIHSLLTGSKYYGNDVGGISTINEFAKAVVQFGQSAVKIIDDENSTPDDWKKLAESQLTKVGEYLAQMTGIPVANINKIISGGKNHVIDIVNGEFGSFEAGLTRANATNARRFYKAWQAGDSAKMDKVYQEMLNNANGDADKARNAISKAFKTAYDADDMSLEDYTRFITDSGLFDEKQQKNRIQTVARDAVTDGSMSEDEAERYLVESGFWDENKAWESVQRWVARAEYDEENEGDEDADDFSWSKYDSLDAAVDAGQNIDNLVSELTEHGAKADNVKDHIKSHLAERFISGEINEKAYKNMLSRYCGIVGEAADKLVRNASVKKQTGYTWNDLSDAYLDGNISAAAAKQALTQNGGMTAAEASARVRYWDFRKQYPDAEMKQETVDKYYDNVINGYGKTLQGSGISLSNFVDYYTKASKATGTDKNGDGKADSGTKKAEIMQIIDALNLTDSQKDALYYYNGWSAKTINEAPWH